MRCTSSGSNRLSLQVPSAMTRGCSALASIGRYWATTSSWNFCLLPAIWLPWILISLSTCTLNLLFLSNILIILVSTAFKPFSLLVWARTWQNLTFRFKNGKLFLAFEYWLVVTIRIYPTQWFHVDWSETSSFKFTDRPSAGQPRRQARIMLQKELQKCSSALHSGVLHFRVYGAHSWNISFSNLSSLPPLCPGVSTRVPRNVSSRLLIARCRRAPTRPAATRPTPPRLRPPPPFDSEARSTAGTQAERGRRRRPEETRVGGLSEGLGRTLRPGVPGPPSPRPPCGHGSDGRPEFGPGGIAEGHGWDISKVGSAYFYMFAYNFHAYISCIFFAYFVHIHAYKCIGEIHMGSLHIFAYLCIFCTYLCICLCIFWKCIFMHILFCIFVHI